MFVWIASYPKSGNTLVRSMLTSYFFSNDVACKFKTISMMPYDDPNMKLSTAIW